MKCPGCSYISSGKDDLCPRCLFDLRPGKLSLGLSVVDAKSSYRELLAGLKRGDVPSVFPVKPSGKKRLRFDLSSIKLSLLRRRSLSTQKVDNQVGVDGVSEKMVLEQFGDPGASDSEGCGGEDEDVQVSSVAKTSPTPEVLDLSQSEEQLDQILDGLMDKEQLEFEAIPMPKEREEEDDFELILEIDEAPEDEPVEHEGREIEDEVNSEGEGAHEEDGVECEEHEGEEVPQVTDPLLILADEHWEDALASLPEEDDLFELSATELKLDKERAKIDMLFDLNYEILGSQSKSDAFQDVIVSEKRQVESAKLSSELDRVTRAVSRSVVSLSSSLASESQPGAGETSQFSSDRPIPLALDEHDRPRLSQVIGAALIDLLFILVWGVILALGLLWTGQSDLRAVLFRPGLWSIAEQVTILVHILGSSLLSLLLYPLVTVIVVGRSYGHDYLGLRVIDLCGGTPKFSQRAIRALCWPLSLLALGGLSILWGGRAVHDWAAETAVVNESE
jgi:uncharacterized RDD family membrane protein YckC